MENKEAIIYQKDLYEGGETQTLSFNLEQFEKIKNETEEFTTEKIFKTRWFERNKEVRYIAQKHENVIDINSINGKVCINLITDEMIKRELNKLSDKEAKKYKNLYYGGIEFTVKAYFQKNINTPIEIYILDDRIVSNLQDSLIAVIRGNLIYQKLKFIIQPDFSISLKDKNKEKSLTLYFKLDGINMLPGSKVISIETKAVYALTGNHQIKKQNNENLLIPKLYSNVLENIEHKENTRITLPEEIEMDFSKKFNKTERLLPLIQGPRLSFVKETSKISKKLVELNLIKSEKMEIKVIILNGVLALEATALISPETENSFVHINKIREIDCENIIPQLCNYPGNNRNILVTKSINLRFKVLETEYTIKIGVLEDDCPYELLLGKDFLEQTNYEIMKWI